MVALSSRVPSARVVAVTVCQNCLTRDKEVVIFGYYKLGLTSVEFCTRHHDAQKDRAAVRAEIEILRRERLAYEQESIQSRQDLARSEAYSRTLEARITLLETEARRHEWQRQAADDLAVQHIMRTQALEAGARIDTLEDTGSSS
ncbi:hypothetical protein Tco_0070731 [Tanacetum coccineum]